MEKKVTLGAKVPVPVYTAFAKLAAENNMQLSEYLRKVFMAHIDNPDTILKRKFPGRRMDLDDLGDLDPDTLFNMPASEDGQINQL